MKLGSVLLAKLSVYETRDCHITHHKHLQIIYLKASKVIAVSMRLIIEITAPIMDITFNAREALGSIGVPSVLVLISYILVAQ